MVYGDSHTCGGYNVITVHNITGGAWTQITALGASGVCWLQEITRRGQVVINHSETESKFDIDGSYFLLNAKRRLQLISADGADDIYYARCSVPGNTAILITDTGHGFVGDPLGKLALLSNGGLPVSDIDHADRTALNTVFGEKITAIRRSDIAAQFQYGFPASSAAPEIANGGTITIVESMLTVATGTNVAGSAAISNRRAIRYLPGQEAFSNFTAIYTSPKADSFQRAGLFDSENGFFIGYEGLVFNVTRRRDGIDENHEIDLESVFDEIDGVYDPTKGNVYRVSFGYLGFAVINFEVMTPRGSWRTLHKIEYPNLTTETHILNTNLQPRIEVENSGNDTSIVVQTGSFSAGVIDGGGGDPASRLFTFAQTEQAITAGTLMVVTFRSKSTFAGLTNYIQSIFTLLSFNTDLSKSSLWELERNATITNAPTWTDINTLDSTIEFSTDAVVTHGTGILDFSIPLGKIDRELITDLETQKIELLPEDWITLFITTGLGTNGTYDLSFRLRELF